jgi:hypothetical protein
MQWTYSTEQYSTMHCSTVQCSTLQCGTVQYSAVRYGAVQCSTESAVPCMAAGSRGLTSTMASLLGSYLATLSSMSCLACTHTHTHTKSCFSCILHSLIDRTLQPSFELHPTQLKCTLHQCVCLCLSADHRTGASFVLPAQCLCDKLTAVAE